MARIETWYKQDLQKPVAVRVLTGNLFSMDNQGNLIGVEVFDDGEPATLSGTVSGNVIRPDGGTVAVSGTLSGNKASIVLPQAAYYVPGLITITIKLTSSSVITTLAALTAVVYRTSTDVAVDPGTLISDINTLIASIDAAVASIPADYSSLWTKLAPAFSTSTAYVAGQYVTYNGGLYRFTTAHAAGSWNSGHVVAVNLGGEITDLKSAISNNIVQAQDDADPAFEPIFYMPTLGVINTSGSTADITQVNTSSVLQYAIIPCKIGDYFAVHVYGGSTGRGYAFIDTNGNVKKVASASTEVNAIMYSAWDGYLVLHNHVTNGAGFRSYRINLNKNSITDLLPFSTVSSGTGYIRYRVPCYGMKKIKVALIRASSRIPDVVNFTDVNGDTVKKYSGLAGAEGYEESYFDVPSSAYYAYVYKYTSIVEEFYCYGGDISDPYKDSPVNVTYPGGRVLYRAGQNITTDISAPYETATYYTSSNLIPCKNAKVLYRNPEQPNGRIIFLLSNNTLEMRNGNRVAVPSTAVAFRASDVTDSSQTTAYFDKEKEYFKVVYDKYEDIDLTDYPIMARVKVNESVFKVTEQTGDSITDSENLWDALCCVYVGKGYIHNHSDNKVILLCGGFGKKLTQDGWASTTEGWTSFIEDLQDAGFTVVCGGNYRATRTTDPSREGIGYTLPTLGNPITAQLFKNAFDFSRQFLNLKEQIGIIGCSQGGILALNYQYLFGNVVTVVEMGALVNLQVQGWNQQTDGIKNCFIEWYGFTDNTTYEADKCKGFDPYTRMVTIGSTKYFESVPVKMICSEGDTVAGSQYQGEIVNAIKAAGGVAEMRLFTTLTHSDIAGGDSDIANEETILWLKRFL